MLLQEALGKLTELLLPACFLRQLDSGVLQECWPSRVPWKTEEAFRARRRRTKGLSARRWRRLPVLVEMVYEAWAVATRSLGLGSHEYNYCGILQTSGLEQTDAVAQCGP